MKYVVTWFIVYSTLLPVKVFDYDQFGRVTAARWVKEYRYDSIPRQREFVTRIEAIRFVDKMKVECSNCAYQGIDSLKTDMK